MFTNDQFSAAHKMQMATMFDLTQKAFMGVEKLVDLNVRTARAALAEAGETGFVAVDPQQVFSGKADFIQPAADKAAAYGREVYDIVAEAQAEVTQFAEDGVSQARAQWMALVDNAVKNAPAGSEAAAGMFKANVIAANDAFDTVQRVGKQAAEGLQANLMAMAPKGIKVAKAAAKSKR